MSYIRSMEMLEQLEAAAIKCAATPVWPLSDIDVIDCLDIAHRLQQEAAAITLHLVRLPYRSVPGTAEERAISYLRSRPAHRMIQFRCTAVHSGEGIQLELSHSSSFIPGASIES